MDPVILYDEFAVDEQLGAVVAVDAEGVFA